MIKHLKLTTIYVGDVDRAIDFWVDRVGFEKRADQPMGPEMRWVEVAPPEAETSIVLAVGFAGWTPEKVGASTGICLNTTDIHGDYERMRDHGVEFTEMPTPQSWGGMQAQFVDQDGNGFVLVDQ